jgi:hypothetical protein
MGVSVTAKGSALFTNGGFESGDGAGWTTTWNPAYTGPTNSGSFSAATGCLGSACISTPTAFLYQDLATVIGQTYDLTFWYANNSPGDEAINELQVLAGGVIVADLINQPQDVVFRQVVTTFTASSGTTRIQFNGRNDPGVVIVDDVFADVSGAVPEPSTWMLSGVGIVALAFLKRRRVV